MFATIRTAAPEFTQLDSSTGMDSLPKEFRAHLKYAVAAQLLFLHGKEDNDAKRVHDEARRQREQLALRWDDKGNSRSTAVSLSVNAFTNDLTSRNSSRVLGPS